MGEKKLKPLRKGLTMADMHLSRFSIIISNLQLAILAFCFILVMGSMVYPILAMFNYIFAFCITFGAIFFTFSTILLELPLDELYNTFIIFPFEVSESIFELLAKITPIASGVLMGFSIATFVTQVFFNSQRKFYRILFSVIGFVFAFIGILIEF